MRTLAAAFLAGILLASPALSQSPADLRLASKAFRAAAGKVAPSVVTIETYGGVAAAPAEKGKPGRGGSRRIAGVSPPGEGPATGLILTADGYILTSTFNFLTNPKIITVTFADGTRRVAKLCSKDEIRGICLLKALETAGLPVPQFAPPDSLRTGQWVVSIGVGFGEGEPALSAGILSALDRLSGMAVQTDANLSPANYGGPLVDLDGRVVGVCASISPQGGGAAGGVAWYDSGIGLAILVSPDAKFLEPLKAGRTIVPGRMGIKIGKSEQGGIVIDEVVKKSPADKAGLAAKDILRKIEGRAVSDPVSVRIAMRPHAAGDAISVEILRGKESKTVRIELEKGDDQPPPPPAEKIIVPMPGQKPVPGKKP